MKVIGEGSNKPDSGKEKKMKKLMIAALVAAMGGVVLADGCGLDCVYAYRIKLSGKTVKGKSVAAKSACETGNCWAKATSYRVAGYIYGANEAEGEGSCATCSCNANLEGNTAIFWDENKVQQFADVTSVEFEVFDILRNSGAKNKAQIAFKLGDLSLAGFGVFNPSTQKLKSASGFFAGTLEAPVCAGAYDSSTCEYGEETTAMVYGYCDDADTAKEAEKAIAFGRWNLAYKATKVAEYSASGDESVFKPAAFTAAE